MHRHLTLSPTPPASTSERNAPTYVGGESLKEFHVAVRRWFLERRRRSRRKELLPNIPLPRSRGRGKGRGNRNQLVFHSKCCCPGAYGQMRYLSLFVFYPEIPGCRVDLDRFSASGRGAAEVAASAGASNTVHRRKARSFFILFPFYQ